MLKGTHRLTENILDIPEYFVKRLNDYLGDFWSFRRFFISCIISIILVLLINYYANQQYESSAQLLVLITPKMFLQVLLVIIIINAIPDYISLQETLWLLQKVKFYNFSVLIIVLLFDLIFTALIFLLLSGGIIYFLIKNPYPSFYVFIWEYFMECITCFGVVKPFFISTFISSILLCLFICVIFISNIIYSFGNVGIKFMSILPITARPFLSLGILIGLFVLFIYVLYVMFSIPIKALDIDIVGNMFFRC